MKVENYDYSNSKSKRYLCWQRSPAHAWGVVGFLNPRQRTFVAFSLPPRYHL
jgi:hypothetical protein